MLDLSFLQKETKQAIVLLEARGVKSDRITSLLELVRQKNMALGEIEAVKAENNRISRSEITALMRQGGSEQDIKILKDRVRDNNETADKMQTSLEILTDQIQNEVASMPNLPLFSSGENAAEILIPVGGEENNRVTLERGQPRQFDFTPQTHDTIGKNLGLLDLETATHISGSRFATLKGRLASLELALINFMTDLHTKEHGYTLVSPPFMVREKAMFGVGQLPKFADESFVALKGGDFAKLMRGEAISQEDVYRLIPTAEVPLTNMVSDMLVSGQDLPLRFVSVTPCFRSEAGSSGRDTSGLIRLHQFMKVELVSITHEDEFEKVSRGDENSEHERMTSCATKVLDLLGLPYRIVELSAGDMGFSAMKTYDLEVWFPSQNKYREISSCSYCGNFQGRRMNARYKNASGKNVFVHTLNGSALAVGRTIAAILENYQTRDGDFETPKILKC